ncbi:hypothetical protein AOZ06_03940 [Kibdelosporangium phytohabitans]|uniref:Glycosyltransferase RgtA/B/C/D-like domain-containing protein n=1 Tax=Kibdelosporangium phytohabitans TaxID=860235 RepID=A0A0N9HW33_9PSEU|nr:hypothetical protein AOZ06_03940 [Kibdelosporangium phytohabitans]
MAVVAGTGLLTWHASYYGSWLVDDAAITFAYARSFTEGLGPVVHPGAAQVEGYSNPAWLLLLALGRLFGVFDRGTLFGIPDYVVFPKAMAALCCAGILAACFTVARRVSTRPALITLLIGGALAAVPSFVVWCFSGLENPLFALAVVGLAALLFHAQLDFRLDTRKVAVLAGGLAALAALTRPDGLIYLLAYPAVLALCLRRGLKLALVSFAAFAVPFGGYLIWRVLTFGILVPNTAVAKKQGFPLPTDLVRLDPVVLYVGTPMVAVFAGLVYLSLHRPQWFSGGFPALGVTWALSVLAYAALEPDWMAQFRFATPIWAMSALIGVIAAAKAVVNLGRRLVTIAVIAVATFTAGAGFVGSAREFHDKPTFHMCQVAERYGRMVNQYADILGLEKAGLLAPDLGGLAMTTRLYVVDLAGLADATIAKYTREDDKAGLRDYIFDQVKPTFIVSHGIWNGGTGVALDPRIERDYHPIYRHLEANDWVRKDAVTDLDKLAAVREYASQAVPVVDQRIQDLPRRSCGETLRAGQVNGAR